MQKKRRELYLDCFIATLSETNGVVLDKKEAANIKIAELIAQINYLRILSEDESFGVDKEKVEECLNATIAEFKQWKEFLGEYVAVSNCNGALPL